MIDADREQLRADVAVMRELGVLRWGEIYLGPAPRPAEPPRELTADEVKARAEAAEDERLAIMFGATGVRPKR